MSPSPSKYEKRAELEERIISFAKDARSFVRGVPANTAASDDAMQLICTSGELGMNYIEANEAPSRKDFMDRVRLCLKDAKESVYWLRLLDTPKNPELAKEHERLQQEATDLFKIFCGIAKAVRQKSAAKPA